MKGIVKILGAFVIGMLAGGSGSYFFTKKKMEEKASNDIKEATDEIRKYYQDKMGKDNEAKKDEPKKDKDDSPFAKSNPNPARSQHKEAAFVREGGDVDYTSFFRNREHPEDDAPEEDEGNSGEEFTNDHAKNRTRRPKPIKVEDFGQDPSYETSTLLFYVEDQALVYEDQSPMDDYPNEDELLGDALDKFGWKDDEEETEIYVRNFARRTDYEVIKVFGAYSE